MPKMSRKHLTSTKQVAKQVKMLRLLKEDKLSGFA